MRCCCTLRALRFIYHDEQKRFLASVVSVAELCLCGPILKETMRPADSGFRRPALLKEKLRE